MHAANTDATLRLPGSHLDLVRVGLGLHGGGGGAAHPRAPRLEPAAQLRARVLRLVDAPAGATVGYGRTFACPVPMRLALLGVGYADGVPRALSNRGSVLIGGRPAPLVGRVSMDQCMADVSAIPGIAVGAVATVYGDGLPLDQVAAAADTNAHELLCRVGGRVPRVYREPPGQ
jgi:alanine racemase